MCPSLRAVIALSLATALALGLVACGGDDDPAPRPTIVDTGDARVPFVVYDEDGVTWVFHADGDDGVATAITAFDPDGRAAHLAIDPADGLPAHLVLDDDTIVTFANWRLDDGLVDVGVIAPDGRSGLERDVAFPPVTTTATTTGALGVSTAALEGDGGAEARSKFTAFLGAVDLTLSSVACGGGVIITGGSSIAGIPTGTAPWIFATGASATTIACGSAAVKLRAMRPENSAAVATADNVLAPIAFAEETAGCVAQPGIITCIKAGAEWIAFGAGGLVRGVYGTYLGLRQGTATATTFAAFCCDGPAQIRAGKAGTWSAIANGDAEPPMTYYVDWGDGSAFVRETSETRRMPAMHHFPQAGTYTVSFSVTDDTLNNADTASAVGAGAYRVEVYDPPTAQCCGVTSRAPEGTRYPGDRLAIAYQVYDGRPPFHVRLDLGDGTVRQQQIGDRPFAIDHVYDDAGTYALSLEVTDADGTVAHATGSVVVSEAPVVGPSDPTTSAACTSAVSHICSNIVGQSCNTARMDNAVRKVQDGCGAAANGIVAAARAYCQSASPFEVGGCVAAALGE